MKTFRRGRTAGAVLFLSTCVFSLAVPGALRAGEQARAFEKAALQAKKQGKYLEAEQAARKALAVLLQQEWTPTPEARAYGAYLLALLDQLDEKTGDTPAALAFLSRLKAGAKVLSGEPAFTASLDLERQKLLVKTFHFQEARSLNSTLGFLCDWQVVGPFDNERGSGFGRVFPPEKKIDLSKSYQGKKRKITWRRVVVSAVPVGIVDMAAFMRDNPEFVQEVGARFSERLAEVEPELAQLIAKVAALAPPEEREQVKAMLDGLGYGGLLEAPAWAEVGTASDLRDVAAKAAEQHRPLLLDVRAQWCVPCKELEKKTFADAEIAAVLGRSFETARLDVTDPDEPIERLQRSLGVSSLPAVLVWKDPSKLAEVVEGRAKAGKPAPAPDVEIRVFVEPAELLPKLRDIAGTESVPGELDLPVDHAVEGVE